MKPTKLVKNLDLLADPIDINLQGQMSFTDLTKVEESNKNIEEALMRKSPKIEQDEDSLAQMEGLFCPEYLKNIILEEIDIEEKKNKLMIEERKKKAKILKLRVHFKLEVKTISINTKKSFNDLTEVVFKTFNITDTENCRLRLFNRLRDEMLNDFKGKENCTLEELKIFSTKSFIVEEKKPEEQFEDYDPLIG